MPTTRPRYQVTDTGEVRELLDAAQARWPEIDDRKLLLLRLARHGAAALRTQAEEGDAAAARRRQAQRRAISDVRGRFDPDVLLGDDAWR